MLLTREIVARKLLAYLRHELTLPQLVDWAENALMSANCVEADAEAIRDAVARLGLADVRAFGLTWEDCEHILHRLGYAPHLEIEAL